MPTSMTDEVMRGLIATARNYTFVILHPTPRRQEPGADQVVWEHARRNFELRAEKRLSIVCPVRDGSDVCGMYLFPGTPEETALIMEGDPGVKAGIFTYDVHPCRGFPGDALP
ncbi:MAG TPA: hypothetical protein VJN62_02480 [Gemmatimonadales bacterium]|nr:hypothetical protein [Gemmatimonadales bacterium]